MLQFTMIVADVSILIEMQNNYKHQKLWNSTSESVTDLVWLFML